MMYRTKDDGVKLEPHEVPIAHLTLATHLYDICRASLESKQQVILGSEWMIRFVHELTSNHIKKLRETLVDEPTL